MIVRPRHHWFRLIFVWHGSVLPQISGRLALIFSVSLLSVVCSNWWLQHFPDSALSIPPFTLMGVALAIFLGFRNSASYERFWEARRQWGILQTETRGLVSKLLSSLPDETHAGLHERTTRALSAFAYALKNQLRDTDATADLARWLAPEMLAEVVGKRFPAQLILLDINRTLTAERQAGRLADMEWLAMSRNLDILGEASGACERIANTPIPYTYWVLMNRTVVIYCLLLPIGITTTLGWLTPLIATFVAYTFLALEVVGEQLEEPFGTEANDLALDSICHTIECTTCELAGLPTLGATPAISNYVLT